MKSLLLHFGQESRLFSHSVLLFKCSETKTSLLCTASPGLVVTCSSAASLEKSQVLERSSVWSLWHMALNGNSQVFLFFSLDDCIQRTFWSLFKIEDLCVLLEHCTPDINFNNYAKIIWLHKSLHSKLTLYFKIQETLPPSILNLFLTIPAWNIKLHMLCWNVTSWACRVRIMTNARWSILHFYLHLFA